MPRARWTVGRDGVRRRPMSARGLHRRTVGRVHERLRGRRGLRGASGDLRDSRVHRVGRLPRGPRSRRLWDRLVRPPRGLRRGPPEPGRSPRHVPARAPGDPVVARRHAAGHDRARPRRAHVCVPRGLVGCLSALPAVWSGRRAGVRARGAPPPGASRMRPARRGLPRRRMARGPPVGDHLRTGRRHQRGRSPRDPLRERGGGDGGRPPRGRDRVARGRARAAARSRPRWRRPPRRLCAQHRRRLERVVLGLAPGGRRAGIFGSGRMGAKRCGWRVQAPLPPSRASSSATPTEPPCESRPTRASTPAIC